MLVIVLVISTTSKLGLNQHTNRLVDSSQTSYQPAC